MNAASDSIFSAIPAQTSGSSQGGVLPKQRVLIIDDEKTNIKILRQLLMQEPNLEVLFATSPIDGLDKARTQLPDLVLLDIMMPEMDGYELCKILKADPIAASIPIIFVTAKDDAKDEEYGLSLGAIDYIAKPFRPAIVRTRVQNQLTLRRTQKELEHLATRDFLTGLVNRRYFMELVDIEIARAKRHKRAISVCFLDLDHFKDINDTYGHDAGDAVLSGVATIIAQCLRVGDIFGRLGGEEFGILLPETDVEGAKILTERIRQKLEESPIPYTGMDLKMTASFGVTDLRCEQEDPFTEALKRADKATYQAKAAGRNTVIVAK